MGKWYDYLKGLDQDKEEEKKEENKDDALSFWTDFQRFKRTGELRDSSAKNTPEEEPERAREEDTRLLSERLADRGVRIELPEPGAARKETALSSKAGQPPSLTYGQPRVPDTRPTLAEAAAQGKSSSLFMDRIGNTYTARTTDNSDRKPALEDITDADRQAHSEYVASLRKPEEIRADIDAAKDELSDARKKWWRDEFLAWGGGIQGRTETLEENDRRNQEIKDRISALEEELRNREGAEKYDSLRLKQDFAEKSVYDKTKNANGEDPLYAYVNGDLNARQQVLDRQERQNRARQSSTTMERILSGKDDLVVETMTPDEIRTFNYLHDTQGSDAAEEYIDYLRPQLNERQMEAVRYRASDWTDQNAGTEILGSVGTVLMGPARGLSYLGQAADYLADGRIDANAPYNRYSRIPTEVRDTVSKDVERKWGKWGSFAYQTGMSMADFLFNSAISGGTEALSLGIMGSGAAADAVLAAKDRGLDDTQSFVLGTIAGAAEIASEKVSVEALFKDVDWRAHPVRYILKNILAEGGEEVESDVINWLADSLVARDKSEWNKDIRQYKKDHPGATDSAAFWAAVKERAVEGGMDFLGGAISGGLMAGGRVALGGAAEAAQRNQDRSQGIEAARGALAARNAARGALTARNAAQTKPMNETLTREEVLEMLGNMEGEGEASTTREEATQAQGAQEGGIVLPTAEEAAGGAEASDGVAPEARDGAEIRMGTEARSENILPTADEAELDERVRNARNITEATGIRYGVDKKTIRTAERFGRLTGNTVEFYSREGKNGTVENGFSSKKTGKLYYNVNAKNPFGFTFGHELTHTLEGTDAYRILSDYALDRLEESGVDLDARRAGIRALYEKAGYGLASAEEIDQEIVADWVGENLTDTAAIREICRKDPSAGKRIRDALDNFVTRAADMGGIITKYEEDKYRNVVKAYDRYLGRRQEAQLRQAEAEADAPARVETPAQTEQAVPAAGEAVRTAESDQAAAARQGGTAPGEESVEDYRARMASLLDAGEIDEEQYDAAMDLADEAEAVGGFTSSTVERDEGPEGKIPAALRNVRDRVTGRQYSVSVDEEQSRENAKKALDYFGRTYSWNETGYITRDGDRIDFSGKRDKAPAGHRSMDHRKISDAFGVEYGGDDYSGGMIRFMGEGNIRIMPESGGISIQAEPTEKQYTRLGEFIQKNRGEVMLDLDNERGVTVESRDYPSGTRSSKVLNDIREYFATGALPEEDMRYSLSAEEAEQMDAEYMAAVEAGDTETAQRMVDEAAEATGYRKYEYGYVDQISPSEIEPRNGVRRDRLPEIEDRIGKTTEWNGRPILVAKNGDSYIGLTGSHRFYIAQRAGIDVNAVVMDDDALQDLSDYLEDNTAYDLDEFLNRMDEDQQADVLKDAVGEGYDSLRDAYVLMAVETESNFSGHADQLVEDPYIRMDGEDMSVKSADPFTYDDEGNVIPLGERFSASEPDIRYSLSADEAEQMDAEYMAAVEAGDTETAQRMVDEAAERAGYTRRMWHGAKSGKTFTKFRGWSYFTEDRAFAEKYTNRDPENLYGVYAKVEHPFDTRTDREARRIFEEARRENGFTQLGDSGLPDWTDGYDLADYIDENELDYDGILLDEGEQYVPNERGELESRGRVESYVIRNSAQVKSADPVTYDDEGNVIPLSQRFNAEKDDIRWSVSEEEDPQTLTENFKNWFGDFENDPENASKVVDEDGRPKRMYHGTNASRDFNFFDTYGSNYGLYGTGSYFTENPEVASSYALNKGRGSSPRIYPVYLNIRNPIDMNAQADIDRWLEALPELADYVVDDTGNLTAETNHDWYRAMEEYMRDEMMRKWEAAEFAQDILRGMGYDGIRHIGGLNRGEGMQHDVWIAFDPMQIKSAIGNRGTFDPEDGDIRQSVSEAEEDRGPIYALPEKAREHALRAENALAASMAQAFGLETRRTTEAYRQFRAEAARPIIEAMIENRDIDPDEIFAQYWNGSLTEGQEARDAFDTALTEAWRKIQEVNRYANEQRAAEEARAQRNAQIDAQIPDTADDIIRLGERYKSAKRERTRVLGQLLLSDEDLELARTVAAGNMAEEEVYARRPFDYQKILEAAAAEREFREADAVWGRYTRRIAERRYEQADRDLTGAENWKDKGSGFAYARETPERNFRDVAGSSASALIDDYIRPIHKAEAESTRMKNEYIKRVADLKLDRKVRRGNAVSEAAAVQWLGEAMDNIRYLETMHRPDAWRDGMTLDEWRSAMEQFRAENPNLDYGKIERGIEEFKKIYDELITEMNRVLVENGYLPVNVRRGYFPHFNGGDDGILQKFAGLLGINIDSQALPTAINGLTSTFKPGKAWFGHAQERTGFRTDYDAVQGFDGYIGGVSDVIHQTANIRNLRALATRIRYQFGDEGIKKRIDEINADDSRSETEKLAAIHDLTENGRYKLSRFVAWIDEYTNLLANKKSRYDRGIEDLMGRKIYTWMKNIEGRVAANMISANLGSALTNFIPLNQAGAILGDFSMLRGAWDTVIGRGRDDGFVRRSDFLTNRRGTDPLIQNRADKISEFLSSPMNLIDNFVSETIVRAAYGKYLRQGMDQQTAMDMADELAAGIMADRSKGAQPTIFGSHNPLMKLVTQFQVEVNNEFSTIFKDIPKGVYSNDKDRKRAVAVAAWTLLRYFIGAYLFNDLYEKIVGRRAALDPVDLLNDAVGDFTGKKLNNVFDMLTDGVIESDKPVNTSQAVGNLVTNTGEELPFVGGLIFGGGRIPMKSAIPDFETIGKGIFNDNWDSGKKLETVGRELGKTVATYWLPPFAGGEGKKLYQTAENTLRGGRYVKNAEGEDQLQYPYFTDTAADTAKTVLKSAFFGPTATEGGRDWVEGGFGSQSAKNTEIYRRLTDEYGESQRASWDFVRSLRGQDAQGKREAVAASGLSDEGKAAAMAEIVSDSERAKFKASGVSADAWAGFFGALPDFDEDGNGSYKQAEVTAALDNVRIPLSSGEGAAQGLLGGDTETRSLTREEKAAIWSAYNPKWKVANNPFDAAVGERVVSRIGQGGE